MNKKKNKYQDDYSLRTLAYYQREGGVYNDLITILQRIRDTPRRLRGIEIGFPTPNKVLNIVSRAYDECLDICTDDQGHFYSFTEDNIESFLEEISEILYGKPFSVYSSENFETTAEAGDDYLGHVELCVLASLFARIPEMREIIPYLTEGTKSHYPQLYNQFVLLIEWEGNNSSEIEELMRELRSKETIIIHMDAQIADMSNKLSRKNEEFLALHKAYLTLNAVRQLEVEETQKLDYNHNLNLDTILDWVSRRKHYKLADQVIAMLKDIGRSIATDEEYERICNIENDLISKYSETSIVNNNMGIGSNILTGLAQNPLMPMGVTPDQLVQKFLEFINNGARRENKD